MSRSNFHENEINEGQNQFLIVPDLKLSLQAKCEWKTAYNKYWQALLSPGTFSNQN